MALKQITLALLISVLATPSFLLPVRTAEPATVPEASFFLQLDTVQQITCQQPNSQDVALGTGTLVGPNLLLTANHVVGGSSKCLVLGREATVVWQDNERDAALLRVEFHPSLNMPVMPHSCDPIPDGGLYYTMGYANGQDFVLNHVRDTDVLLDLPSDTRYPHGTIGLRLMYGLAKPGMSGGPVVNENGEQVGTIIGTSDTPSGMHFTAVQPLSNTKFCQDKT